jgi:TRIAD3 protein (E3 ubiquitin-protein ligase RNF216)
LYLASEIEIGDLPYKKKAIASRGKGKGRQLHDDEFERERIWLANHLTASKTTDGNKENEADNDSDDGECEGGIECGCCFSTFSFVRHIFIILCHN